MADEKWTHDGMDFPDLPPLDLNTERFYSAEWLAWRKAKLEADLAHIREKKQQQPDALPDPK